MNVHVIISNGGHDDAGADFDGTRRQPSPLSVNNQHVILQNPRPKNLRTTNDYIDVVNKRYNRRRRQDLIFHDIFDDDRPMTLKKSSSNVDNDLPSNACGKFMCSTTLNLDDNGNDDDLKTLQNACHLSNGLSMVCDVKQMCSKDIGSTKKTTSSTTTMTSNIVAGRRTLALQPTIICSRCGRCRCKDCTKRREIPSNYLCGDQWCLYSPDCLVDCLSCVCCIKACLYHFDSDDDRTYDPCDVVAYCCPSLFCRRWRRRTSSNDDRISRPSIIHPPPKRINFFKRLLLLASCFILPCLWCYWPLKICSNFSSYCYARCHDNGCRCLDRRHVGDGYDDDDDDDVNDVNDANDDNDDIKQSKLRRNERLKTSATTPHDGGNGVGRNRFDGNHGLHRTTSLGTAKLNYTANHRSTTLDRSILIRSNHSSIKNPIFIQDQFLTNGIINPVGPFANLERRLLIKSYSEGATTKIASVSHH